MADDLDDEWWTSAQNEGETSEPESDHSVEASENAAPVKRKAEAIDDDKGADDDQADNTDNKEKKKKAKRKRNTITVELKAKGSKSGTAEDLVQVITKHYKDKLSTVEWDNIKIDTDRNFFVSADKEHTPVSYLRTILPKWKKMLKTELKPGSPLVLLVSASAIRSVQLNREILDFKSEQCQIAKLFAKHFKLEEQQKFLAKKVCHIGLGTPNRLHTLVKSGSLHLDNVAAVVLDWNWRDIKSKRMVDIPEIRGHLMDFMKDFMIPHMSKNHCKIGML
ncbi:protein CMSS1-like [Mizuhopecten yessoensis]|uniref:protein CMSS1-like n=1 Tax=Mizuhopecten yessoensis TaxID=6573 RepID=UPI000B45DC85|nr:protein CMSS1-like [Mizuhopecten yessoensis]